MSNIALGNNSNYTIGGLRFYFSENYSGHTAAAIVAVSTTPGSSSISLATDLTALVGLGSRITITDSTGNDGTYDVASAVYSNPNTVITLVQDLSDATVDGDAQIVRKKELYLGNVVTGSFTSDITFLDHYTAKSGTRVKDRSIVQEISVSQNLTMDEPNVDAMNLFMLGGTISTQAGTPASRRFAPYTNTERSGGARLCGVSNTGNEWVWTIHSATLKPDGEFSYNDQDWSQFSFVLEVLSDSEANPTTPFGYVDHYGAGEDIVTALPLTGN